MRKINIKFLTITLLATLTLIFTACDPPKTPNGDSLAKTDAAATVNGKEIKMEDVERAIKQQAKGEESKLSQLELAKARLAALEQLIQTEVLYQKAESEGTIPTDEEVTTAFNKMKTESGRSQEEFDKEMKKAGETEESVKVNLKKQLAINKLIEKVAGKVTSPKDSEIEAFYNGNKEAFVKKRGVKLAAIVIDPRKTGENDTTVDEASTQVKLKEISRQINSRVDFAEIARKESEDPSRVRGGDLGYITEDQLKQNFPQIAGFMDPKVNIGQLAGPFNIGGKLFIFKLQERSEKDEELTLESPGVRKQITDSLVNARKQLLSASYAAMAMNEAKIVNHLAKKVIDSPNELSGARPAQPAKDKDKDKDKDDKKSDSDSKSDKKEEDKDAKKDDKKDDAKSDDKKDDKAKSDAKTDDKKEGDKKEEDKKSEKKK